jgi:tripartite-type tricarboxylate transporter receptor subunit TctC
VVDALARQVKLTTERADFKARVEKSGATMSYTGPAELGKYTAEQVTHWTGIIRKLNIPMQ